MITQVKVYCVYCTVCNSKSKMRKVQECLNVTRLFGSGFKDSCQKFPTILAVTPSPGGDLIWSPIETSLTLSVEHKSVHKHKTGLKVKKIQLNYNRIKRVQIQLLSRNTNSFIGK